MAEEFEVRGLHEDRLDEAAEKEPSGMAGQLAVMTAILATVGAMFLIWLAPLRPMPDFLKMMRL